MMYRNYCLCRESISRGNFVKRKSLFVFLSAFTDLRLKTSFEVTPERQRERILTANGSFRCF